ncbi:MAG: 3'(2'),5'-bisphosphate nucleotidase CysQ [Bacteroidota bacterium]|nr:3'(2'),5'-bisphosphate nucleotidase CysQ [Bacteroidota bacterium]
MKTEKNINIKELIKVSKQAGKKILEIYNSNIDKWDISKKDDNSPLTLADKESNKIICSTLEKLYPEIPIISEEEKEIPYEVRSKYEYYWLIDPLDGTKEFIKRNGEFTVNIALVKNHRVVLGVVYVPVMDKLYWGRKNDGAFLIDKNNNESKLQSASFSLSDKNLKIVASRSHLNDDTKKFMGKFKTPQTVSMGSSLKFMLIAEGKAHIYPRIAPTMEWDTAASQIIVEEAGGKVLKYENNEQFTYNKKSLLNGFFVVYGNVQD